MIQEQWWYQFLAQFWEIWAFLLFLGITIWAFWPGNREKWERAARIPFEEDDGDGR